MVEWRYLIAIGSNRGDRHAQLGAAAAALAATGEVHVQRWSPVIETAPVGGPPNQQPYLNGAWIVTSGLGPHSLLARIQRIEQELGRVRTVACGPRTIDLDLIMREDGLVVNSAVLTLPHPRWCERDFVRIPILAIAHDWPVVQAALHPR